MRKHTHHHPEGTMATRKPLSQPARPQGMQTMSAEVYAQLRKAVRELTPRSS